jgi:hypothetical protein
MRRIGSDCCALAKSGHAAAAPPSRVMKSRRFIQPANALDRGSRATNAAINFGLSFPQVPFRAG